MPIAGYIYVAFNPAMPTLVKVGRTTRDPRDRARELSGTSVPTPFRILMHWHVSDVVSAEYQAHAALDSCREAKNREFFSIELPDAIVVVGKAIRSLVVTDLDADGLESLRAVCRSTSSKCFTRDYRLSPPVTISHEVTEALDAMLLDCVIPLAKRALAGGAGIDAIGAALWLAAEMVSGPVQFWCSNTELAMKIVNGFEVLMELLSDQNYGGDGVWSDGAMEESLQFAAGISQLISHVYKRKRKEKEAEHEE